MKKLLLLLLCLASSLVVSAATSGKCGTNLTWTLENEVLTISGTGAMEDYHYNNVPWYSSSSTISRVIISSGVTSIGDYAFYGCSGLISITIPNSVTSIGDYAFAYCSSLTSVTIPNSVTSIGRSAFYGCYIQKDKFINNSSYSSTDNWGATLCDEETTEGLLIKNNIAVYCRRWATSITIPNSVTSIGNGAFRACSGLTSVTIPNSVTSIGRYAFEGCYIQKDKFINNSSCNSADNWGATLFDEETADGLIIKDNVAIKCRPWTTSVTIPNSVTSIGWGAFEDCSGLTSITIPNSVTSIGNSAFRACSGLTSVTIPNSVTSIGENAFSGCSGLTSVNITDLASWCNISFGSYEANPTYYAHKLVLNGTEIKDLMIPEGVTEVKHNVFSGCRGLTSVTIPNSVTSIGSSAFRDCSGLTSITIPNSVMDIGWSAFSGCSGLTSVSIPNSVTSIGERAFYGCKLMSIRFLSQEAPKTGDDAFSNPTYYHATAYVPMGSWINYAYHDQLYQFINIREEATNSNQVETQNAYFIMDYANMSCLKYDKVNNRLVNVASSGPFDESDLDASWTLVKVNGTYYVYNMGAEKFLDLTPTGYVLQTTPTALTISNAENALRLGNNNTEWSLVRNTQLMPKDLTGVGTVLIDTMSNSADCTYYNLQGQKGSAPARGINVVNGRKIMTH